MQRKNAKLSIILALTIVASMYSATWLHRPESAYADGMSFESLPAFLVEGRPVSLSIQIDPPVLAGNASNPSLKLRLFDPTNNQTIPHVSYLVYATKGNEEMMNLRFHSHSGPLKLNIHPQSGPAAVLNGEQNQGIWTAKGDESSVQSPMMLEGGLYHFQVTILGMNRDSSFFDPGVAPVFDSWLSVGEAFHGNLSYDNQDHDITIISYYDRISGFSFDPLANTIHWSMPFDWNLDRIQNQSIFVHEEVQMPKSFIKFLNSTSLFPAVNGVPLKASSVAVDPYSSEGNYVIHYLINKDSIIQIRDQQESNFSKSGLMSFSLFINSHSSAQQTSADFITTSGIRVRASWQPTNLTPNNNSTLTVQFFDVLSETAFTNASVIYDLVIADKNRMEIVNKVSLMAVNGIDSQTINFPANDTYKISISVTGIERQGRDLDQSRDGEATGIVVVPEFPDFLAGVNNTGLILGAMISVMLFVTMKSRQHS